MTNRQSPGQRVLTAILQTLCFYLFTGWVYVAIIAVFRPDSLAVPLWHDVSWLRRDTFGAIAFAGSFVCYVLLQYRSLRRGNGTRETRQRPSP
ncbi:MAG: hypothetical protein ACLPSM_11265 [Acidimicrobiales bacterium]